MDPQRREELLAKLNAVYHWPAVYTFKFILKPEEEKVTKLRTLFDESAQFSSKESSKGNYVSITVKELIVDPDTIFDRYTNATAIEGVIAL